MNLPEQSLESHLGLSPEILIDGRYRLKKLLGAGGGGEVWEAEDAVDAEAWRSVALKLLKTPERGAGHASSPSPGSEHDWLHEARAVSKVNCEALPQIHTVGMARSPAIPFIAMELLEGETLEKRLRRGPIHWRKALAITKQIAIALDACHAAGVIHCDLKPRNVFLEHIHKRRVLVLDFGIASLGGVLATVVRPRASATPRMSEDTDVQAPDEIVVPEVAAAPPIFGTPGYISPERLAAHLPEHRDDAFALGVVLHRMIAGRLPQRLPPGAEAASSSPAYKGPGPYETALHRATVERMFEPLEGAAPATPRAVTALVATLLGPSAERPPKGQLASAVEEVYRRPHGRPPAPYAGLEAFGERRMGHLPGRAGDIEPIVRRLSEQACLFLCGPSGAGKSSLAVAGVAARVDEEMLFDTEGWVTVVLRPSGLGGGLRLAADTAPRAPEGSSVGTLVVVDQFEEVLSLKEGDQQAFCRAFTALVTKSSAVDAGEQHIRPADAVRVVATVRDDLFGRVAALPELERLPESNLYIVRGVDPNAAREIVIGPLEGTGYTLEQAKGVDVVADVARELERDASALPLVQFALARLWDRRDVKGRVLRARAWTEIGGIMGALGEAAQGLFEGLEPGEQQAARRLFLALFDVDGTRNVVDEAALDGAAAALVPQLVKQGLVRRRVEEGQRAVIEPLHEALAKGWPQLSRWLDEVRGERELGRDAQQDAKRWERHGHPDDRLWRGTSLKNTEALRAIREEPGRAFVAASLAADKRERRRYFWLIKVGPAAGSATVLAIALTGWWITSLESDRTSDARKKLAVALAESKENEHKAKASETDALEQKRIAEQRQKEAEEAKQKVTELGKQYRDDFEALRKATTLKELEAAKKKIDEKRGTAPTASSSSAPKSTAGTTLPRVGDPFE
jgi:eukaryotic-like serine/threonine-protein kinase